MYFKKSNFSGGDDFEEESDDVSKDVSKDGTEDEGSKDGTEDEGSKDGTEDEGSKDGTEDEENRITRRMDSFRKFLPRRFFKRTEPRFREKFPDRQFTESQIPESHFSESRIIDNRRMMMYRYPSESRNCLLNPMATHELKTKLVSSPGGFGTKIILKECKGNIARMRAMHKARQQAMLRQYANAESYSY